MQDDLLGRRSGLHVRVGLIAYSAHLIYKNSGFKFSQLEMSSSFRLNPSTQ